ncbi:unnamed protein product [Meganyctiphanes norvegica]|uniref:peptide chain release factor N(5)-glutamine methyltransferase n=1 Tax=Meganyctiphanes norvegica TaxID=48144 RepID=A0AAV2R208_MEGNR
MMVFNKFSCSIHRLCLAHQQKLIKQQWKSLHHFVCSQSFTGLINETQNLPSKKDFLKFHKISRNHPITSSNIHHYASCQCHTSSKAISQTEGSTDTETSICNSTIGETMKEWTGKLEAAGVPEADLSTQHIICHVLNINRMELIKYSDSHLTEKQNADFERLMNCRYARMPVQYIIGHWDFHNITLKLRPPVFIPRPETEQLVELALERICGQVKPKILEIGCGSGAISCALLKAIPDLEMVALDHSQHAIKLTHENAQDLGVSDRLVLVEGKVTKEGLPPLPHDEYDLIVSNPPYVLRKDAMALAPEIMIYEDMRALDGGKEGLDIIKPLLKYCSQFLIKGRTMLLEVDPCHRFLITHWLASEKDNRWNMKVFQDFNEKDRFLEFTKE